MRVSVPGLPGIYYDTNTGSTAIGVATTAIGRKAPKPKGYAIQLLPYLWSFEVDLREVPTDHPVQYLHPEGAQSIGELATERPLREAGTELESVFRFVLSVNQALESTTNEVLGRPVDTEGVTIEIQEGTVSVDGDDLETDEFDLETGDESEFDDPGGGGDGSSDDATDDLPIDSDGPDSFEDDSNAEEFDVGNEL